MEIKLISIIKSPNFMEMYEIVWGGTQESHENLY